MSERSEGTKVDSTVLLACPFCGKRKCVKAWMDADDTDGAWIVSCDVNKGGCGSSTGYLYATERDAATAWNTRHANAKGEG